MAQATTEVPQADGGLPQLKVIEDGTFTNQIAWLVLTFIVLYVVIAKMVLPRVGSVLQEREESIAGNLDTAERLRAEAEEIKKSYEAAVAEAKANAQQTILDSKAEIQASFSKAQSDLDAKLTAQAEDAEKRILAAKTAALESVGEIAGTVTKEIIGKLAGDADVADKAINDAVSAALNDVKGA